MAKKSLPTVSIGKNIFFLIIFIIIVFVLYFNVVVISIEKYKEVGNEIKKYNKIVVKTKKEHDYYENRLRALKSANRKILRATLNEYTALEVGKYLQSNFVNFDIQDTQESITKSNFKFVELDIKTTTKSIINFYRFLQQMNSSYNIIKVAFPVELVSQGDNIEIRFKLKIYTFRGFEPDDKER
jgi:cell division protein FtsL